MKKAIKILFAFLILSSVASGQIEIRDSELLKVYNSITSERVYLHQNSTLIFAGERLYFSLYCLNAKTNKLSEFSKVAYVEMLGSDQQVVFKQRVRLNSGLGHADFFLPTSVASGSYKLVAYTRWMKNAHQDSFFQSDIFVINPYQTNEKVLPLPPDPLDSTLLSEPEKKFDISSTDKNSINEVSKYLNLLNEKRKFKKREKTSIILNLADQASLVGNFSLSVRKVDELQHPSKIKAEDFLRNRNTKKKDLASRQNQIFLPELRGELISGKITHRTTGEPVEGKKVSLSIPGSDFVYDVANSNENGFFFFNLYDGDYGDTGIFQVIDDFEGEYEIAIDEHPSLDYEKLEFSDFLINKSMKDVILERSVQNQIENSYAETRRDVVLDGEGLIPFYRNPDEQYDLDDYTRFNTIEETMVEIIDHVWIRNDKDGSSFFQVRPNEGFPESGLRPLLIVDGVFVEKHEDFMEFNSKRVRRISLSRDKFIMGSYTFQGLLVINTITADYHRTYYKDYLKNVPLFRPQPRKNYFSQQYPEENKALTDRIPDFRTQLFWLPNLELNGEEKKLEFYTSDISGDYEICLEGFSPTGRPISDRAIITID